MFVVREATEQFLASADKNKKIIHTIIVHQFEGSLASFAPSLASVAPSMQKLYPANFIWQLWGYNIDTQWVDTRLSLSQPVPIVSVVEGLGL